ncbi:lysophospholipid acyltransferase family protein [Hazenella coriacea]|uniref:1-acyl-sn-glycerol-3-phosphate acyltransferase n=1 Tax=Hazenella coriacea TaxID=1179467 RepID=A0A4V2UVE7_9BACL|nr:lysophospholipid acyltransferase family protein [Hazenella coriacea]TCS95497.1 1-acyl-sn-glycerol-3-phosphate acyltransferase [Hazenella coriacea]
MIYAIAKWVIKMFLHTYHRVEVYGMEDLPRQGSLIVVGNHVSYLDSFYIASLLPRPVHFMARQESFAHPITRRLLHFAGAFPVNREKPEIRTMRTALRYLEQQEVVGIFPEGGIDGDGSFQEIKQGASYLATKGNCPILPVYIEGTQIALPEGQKWIKPIKITLYVGNPIIPPDVGSSKEKQLLVSEQIQQQLRSLKNGIDLDQTG